MVREPPHAHAVLCGRDGAPAWTITPVATLTPRAGLGIAATGRSIRIGDVTGDGVADFQIELTGSISLTSGHFVL